jgi:hypothetical protein
MTSFSGSLFPSIRVRCHHRVSAQEGVSALYLKIEKPQLAVKLEQKEQSAMDVGFIGLGNMGLPMARNLLKAGHRLRVYNRTKSRAEPLQQEGATIVNSPAEASACDVVITMLANDQAVEETVFGEEGVLMGLKKGAAHISMSTITVTLSERLKEAQAEAGQTYIAAPVFGCPDAAAAAKLFIVSAGEKKAIERFQPLFDAVGQRTFFIERKCTRGQPREARRKFPHCRDDRMPGRNRRSDA